MTKKELLQELKKLLEENGMYSMVDINSNSNKANLENAIECLKCNDEELLKRLEGLKEMYPNIYNRITNDGTDFESFKHHSFNRLFVYNTTS